MPIPKINGFRSRLFERKFVGPLGLVRVGWETSFPGLGGSIPDPRRGIRPSKQNDNKKKKKNSKNDKNNDKKRSTVNNINYL